MCLLALLQLVVQFGYRGLQLQDLPFVLSDYSVGM